MSLIGKAAAIIAAAGVVLISTAPAQAQSCKAACNTSYSACQKTASNSDVCLKRWLSCKKKCAPKAPTPASAQRSSPAPAKR